MKIVWKMLSVFFLSSSSFAMTETFQNLTPQQGQLDLRVGAIYNNVTTQNKFGTTATSDGSQIPMSVIYGIYGSHAVEVDFSYTSLTSKGISTSEQKGFDNIFVGYRGNWDLDPVTIFVKTGFEIPPEKASQSVQFNNDSSSNSSTGQLSYSIMTGILTTTSFAKLGVLAEYQTNRDGDMDYSPSPGTTFSGKIQGGDAYGFGAFGEIDNSFHPNVMVAYTRHMSSDFLFNGIATSWSNGYETMSAQGTMRFLVTPNIEIIPELAYMTLLNQSDMNLSKYDSFYAGLSARFVF
ncbi:MAG TPA: hypothetical protein VN132_14820 [Bdellovibrio sp.]|nr:hypothetical protein [Bdellovibrio sp.]